MDLHIFSLLTWRPGRLAQEQSQQPLDSLSQKHTKALLALASLAQQRHRRASTDQSTATDQPVNKYETTERTVIAGNCCLTFSILSRA